MGFKGKEWEGWIDFDQVEGSGESVNYDQFDKKKSFRSRSVTWYFHGLLLLFKYFLPFPGMQMTFSMLFIIFTFKDQYLAHNLTNSADTPKIVDSAVFMGSLFPTVGDP